MPTINNVDYRTTHYVQIKDAWSGSWTTVPYLYATMCERSAAPQIGTATLIYDFGTIKREDASAYATYAPNSLVGWYVKIVTNYNSEGDQTCWVGVVTDQLDLVDHPTDETGRQVFTARELGFILDRKSIYRARIPLADGTYEWIDHTPTFNKRSERGEWQLGNRTQDPIAFGGDVYTFDATDDAAMWSAYEVAKYLIYYFKPDTITIELTGQVDNLREVHDVWNFDGQTLWQALNTLISRKYGCGFWVDASADTVYLRVFSTTDTDITVGGSTIYANPDTTTLTLPTSHPYYHLLRPIEFRQSITSEYDKIEVRGGLIKCTGTFTLGGMLLKGWPDDLETDYKDASGSTTDYEANDLHRSDDKYENVYSQFILDPDWDGKTGDEDGANLEPLLFQVDSDGSIDTAAVGAYWLDGKKFERHTPFYKNFDYTTDPPTRNGDETQPPEYRSIFGFVNDDTNGTLHKKKDKWIPLEKIHEIFEELPNITVRPHDRQIGVSLSASPQHYLALNHWTSAKISDKLPEFDYSKIIVTGTVQHDYRVKVIESITTSTPAEYERRLVIDAPEITLWYVVPGTIVGIDGNGDPKAYAGPQFIQDGREQLEGIAAAAKAWYGKPRQAVTIEIQRVKLWVELGYIITDIVGAYTTTTVNAVVTKLRTTFGDDSANVMIETGWGSLDYAPEFVR